MTTVIADCSAGRLIDVIRQELSPRIAPGVTQGRFCSVTLPSTDAEILLRALHGRGISCN